MTKTKLLAPALLALSLTSAPAHAVSFVSGPGSVSLDRTDDFSWTVNFTATVGDNLPGTTGSVTFNFLSAVGNVWNFSYSVDNTSTAPSASSRLGVFGFDTSGTVTSVSTGAGNRFSAALNGGNFSGLGNREVCFFSGPNCNGSGGNGVTVAEAPVPGTFSLTLSMMMDTLVLSDFAARWQATGPNAEGSNSGPGTITFTPPPGAIPEPATWAMMIMGFGLVGMGLRRGKRGDVTTRVRFV